VLSDVTWVYLEEKFDEEEDMFIKIAIELEVEPIVYEFYTSDSVMQGVPLNIALGVILVRFFLKSIEDNIRVNLLLMKTFERIS
jgi:hypothetical protein